MRYPNHLFLLLFATLLASACENSEADLKERSRKKMGVDEATNIESLFSQAGQIKAKLTAPLMYRYQDTLPRIEFPDNLHVDFYNDSSVVESILDAKYGRYIEGQNKMYLRDSVVVIQKFNRDTLRCEELWWDQNKQKFYSNKPVKISKSDGTIIPAQGLEASQDFRDIEILDPADGRFTFIESEFAAVTGDNGSSIAPPSTPDSTSTGTPAPPAKDSTNN